MSAERELASRAAVLFPQTVGLRWNALEPTWKGEKKRSFEAMHVRALKFASERFAKQIDAYATALDAVQDLD